jgi:hypothetical protein
VSEQRVAERTQTHTVRIGYDADDGSWMITDSTVPGAYLSDADLGRLVHKVRQVLPRLIADNLNADPASVDLHIEISDALAGRDPGQ